MVPRHSLFRTYIAKHIQLLLVFSAHAFFLSGCAVETRAFRGSTSASNRVFPQPAREPLKNSPIHRVSVYGVSRGEKASATTNFGGADGVREVRPEDEAGAVSRGDGAVGAVGGVKARGRSDVTRTEGWAGT